MSTIADFNRIEDCEKIDAQCVDAFVEGRLSETEPSILEIKTSWGDSVIDLKDAVEVTETLTTLYLSPEDSPNCLVYEPEWGDNICITGDALSRIISMTHLKDVDQNEAVSGGDVYMYNSSTHLFSPFDLQTFVTTTTAAIESLQNRMSALELAIANHETRIQAMEAKLTPPSDAPANTKVVFGTINLYSDPNAAINSSGVVTSLDKTHGLYTHTLSSNVYGDEIMG